MSDATREEIEKTAAQLAELRVAVRLLPREKQALSAEGLQQTLNQAREYLMSEKGRPLLWGLAGAGGGGLAGALASLRRPQRDRNTLRSALSGALSGGLLGGGAGLLRNNIGPLMEAAGWNPSQSSPEASRPSPDLSGVSDQELRKMRDAAQSQIDRATPQSPGWVAGASTIGGGAAGYLGGNASYGRDALARGVAMTEATSPDLLASEVPGFQKLRQRLNTRAGFSTLPVSRRGAQEQIRMRQALARSAARDGVGSLSANLNAVEDAVNPLTGVSNRLSRSLSSKGRITNPTRRGIRGGIGGMIAGAAMPYLYNMFRKSPFDVPAGQ